MKSESQNEEHNIEDAEVIDNAENTLSDKGYSPFDEPVVEREYTKPNIDPDQVTGEIEEPVYERPTLEDFADDDDIQQESKSTEQPKSFNPEMNDLDNKEKQKGAEMIADVCIDGYSRLKKGLGTLAQFSEQKLEKEIAEGNIRPDLEIPIDEKGNRLLVRDFVKEYNESTKDAFETDDEFKEKVKEPLVRVFKKRGVGMTDEQLILYLLGTDLATSGLTAINLKKSTNTIIESLREQTEHLKGASQKQKKSQTSESFNEYSEEEAKEQVYHEPEERTKQKTNNFRSSVKSENLPEYGNPEILSEIDRIAEEEAKN